MDRRTVASGMVLIVVRLLLMPVSVTPAVAAASPCADRAVWHYGALFDLPHTTASAIAGASADIDIRANDLCGGSSNHVNTSSAWSMLQNTTSSAEYAQIGYIRRSTCGGCLQFFWEVHQSPGDPVNNDFFGSPNVGNAKRFKVTWQDGAGEDNHIHLYICDSGGGNCDPKRETTWNPTSAGWDGSLSLFSGETHDRTTDMPGTDGNRADFNQIQVRSHPGGPWFSPNNMLKCLQNSNTSGVCDGDTYSAYHFQWVNTSDDAHFRIWTDPVNR